LGIDDHGIAELNLDHLRTDCDSLDRVEHGLMVG
jgi:hypothetical protein